MVAVVLLVYCCSWFVCVVMLQVVVIFIICTITLLVLYMLFLLCLDPFLSRRPKSYVEHRNEEVSFNGANMQLFLADCGNCSGNSMGYVLVCMWHWIIVTMSMCLNRLSWILVWAVLTVGPYLSMERETSIRSGVLGLENFWLLLCCDWSS